VANKGHKALAIDPAVRTQQKNPSARRTANGRSRQREIPKIVTESFSELVARQGKLVQKQEKAAKAVESRAKRVVARAKMARKQADSAERSAVEMRRELPHR